MIQSVAYDLIKEEGRMEGRAEGMKDAIFEVLVFRFPIMPAGIVRAVDAIKDLQALYILHREAIAVKSIKEFNSVLKMVNQLK